LRVEVYVPLGREAGGEPVSIGLDDGAGRKFGLLVDGGLADRVEGLEVDVSLVRFYEIVAVSPDRTHAIHKLDLGRVTWGAVVFIHLLP